MEFLSRKVSEAVFGALELLKQAAPEERGSIIQLSPILTNSGMNSSVLLTSKKNKNKVHPTHLTDGHSRIVIRNLS